MLLPARYHPYPRSTAEMPDEHLMARVDYRYSPQPSSPVAFGPSHSSEPISSNGYEDIDNESDESHFFAVYNFEVAVRGNKQPRLRNRSSLTNLVVDLALLLKKKCKRFIPSGSASSARVTVN